MKKQEFIQQVETVISILNEIFGTDQRYDISSRIYVDDLYDDFSFIKQHLDQTGAQRVLDIGCGKGHLTALLSRFLGMPIEAVDLEESFGEGGAYNVEHLGGRWQENAWKRFEQTDDVHYQFYDGKRLPFDAAQFDVLVAYAVIEHVNDEDAFLQECYRVLAPGGMLFIFRCPTSLSITENIAQLLHMPHHDRRYSQRHLTGVLERNHFALQKIQRYDTFPAFVPPGFSQEAWNRLFCLTSMLKTILGLPPLVLGAHHFRVVSHKIQS